MEITKSDLAIHAEQINMAVSAYIEAQGMIAANRVNEIRQEYPSYDEGSFQRVLECYGLGVNGCIDKKHSFYE